MLLLDTSRISKLAGAIGPTEVEVDVLPYMSRTRAYTVVDVVALEKVHEGVRPRVVEVPLPVVALARVLEFEIE